MAKKSNNDVYASSLFGNDEAYKECVEKAKKSGKKPKKTKENKFEKAKPDDTVNKETKRLEDKGRKEAEENKRLIAQGLTKDMFGESLKRVVSETVDKFVKEMIM
jgi:hypothetical protein